MESQKTSESFPSVQKLLSSYFPTHSSEIPELLKDKAFDRALGCIFGSFFGDSLGSYVQFTEEINDELMDTVMLMPGGGKWKVYPGQLTDDSQLALALGFGLCSYNPNKSMQEQDKIILKNIALQYHHWMCKSNPFDMGSTTKGAQKILSEVDTSLEPTQYLNILKKNIIQSEINRVSCSNGSLMRIAPMCVFRSFLSDLDLTQFIKSTNFKIQHKPTLRMGIL